MRSGRISSPYWLITDWRHFLPFLQLLTFPYFPIMLTGPAYYCRFHKYCSLVQFITYRYRTIILFTSQVHSSEPKWELMVKNLFQLEILRLRKTFGFEILNIRYSRHFYIERAIFRHQGDVQKFLLHFKFFRGRKSKCGFDDDVIKMLWFLSYQSHFLFSFSTSSLHFEHPSQLINNWHCFFLITSVNRHLSYYKQAHSC